MVNLDYLYNPEIAKPFFGKNYFVDKKLGFQIIENGTILSHKRLPEKDWWGFGGIVNSNGEFIKSSALRDGYCKAYTPPSNQFNIVQKLLFTLECSLMLGGTSLPTIFAASGFLGATTLNAN